VTKGPNDDSYSDRAKCYRRPEFLPIFGVTQEMNKVRQFVGYRRYTSDEAADLLDAIYRDLRAYINFFQPVLKLIYKERRGARVYKKYDQAKTPHHRATLSPDV
jgi:hypothetical protein